MNKELVKLLEDCKQKIIDCFNGRTGQHTAVEMLRRIDAALTQREAVEPVALPDFWQLTFENGHGCPSCGRLYTTPPSGVREGMLRAAFDEWQQIIFDESREPRDRLQSINVRIDALRASAEKLPQGVVVPVERIMKPTIDHSCSYFCDKPECIKAQRDELREKLAALDSQPVPVEPDVIREKRSLV
ncbi:MAG: hypothetical protein E6R03_05785, partial [Hyphomicrobiaceae bacterium]